MQILSITAGAADMYCGSCLRDNALAAELIRRGHPITLLPIYTPTVTDEPNMSAGNRVFFGGISVYLQEHVPLFRYTPRLLDRLWDAPGVIKRLASGSIDVDPRRLGALTVSSLKGEGGNQRKEIAKLLDFLRGEPAPDLVNLPNSMLIALAAPIRRALDRPIVVTLQGEDLFLDGLPEPYRSDALALIRKQIGDVDLFVSVSDYYTDYMSEYLAIPRSKIRTVPLGITITDLVPRPGPSEPITIGYLARIAPEKGLHNLVEAYRILRQERGLGPARLIAAGYIAPAQRTYLADLERTLASWGLAGEFEYAGVVDRAEKVRFLHRVDIFSVPTDYHEPKGLFLLEALACGVPAVQPNHGAFPEILQRTGGGMLAASQQPRDLATAMETLWRDPARRAELGRKAAAGVRSHYTIERMTDRMLDVYGELVNHRARSQQPHQDLSITGR